MEKFLFTESQRDNLLHWADQLDKTVLPQSYGYLRTQEGFCCLGIYLHFHAQRQDAVWKKDEDIFHYHRWATCVLLPPSIEESLGLDQWIDLEQEQEYFPWLRSETGIQPMLTLQHFFSLANDRGKLTFPEIAHIIRRVTTTGYLASR